MTTWHQKTPEEITFDQLVDAEWESLSEAARTVVKQTMVIASRWYLIDSISYMPEWQEDDMKAIHRTAADLTEHDCEGLTKIWRSALVASASVDPYDYETLVKYRAYCADLHGYYKVMSFTIQEVEWEKRWTEFRKKELAEQESADKDLPS